MKVKKIPLSKKKKEEIKKAMKNWRKMWKEVEPFIKKKKVKEHSTIGEWKAFSHEL